MRRSFGLRYAKPRKAGGTATSFGDVLSLYEAFLTQAPLSKGRKVRSSWGLRKLAPVLLMTRQTVFAPVQSAKW